MVSKYENVSNFHNEQAKLTCVDSCRNTHPKESDYIGSDTLTRLFWIIIWKCYGSNFSVGRPIVDKTSSFARHVCPFTLLQTTSRIALNQLPTAVQQIVVDGVVVSMVFNERLQNLHRLLLVKGQDRRSNTIRLSPCRERLTISTMLSTVLLHKPF